MKDCTEYMERVFDAIYTDRSWKDHQLTRKYPHKDYRHLVRYFAYHLKQDITLEQVAMAEAILLKRKPVGHETIIHSLKVVEEELWGSSRFYQVRDHHRKLVTEYPEYPREDINQRFERFRAMPVDQRLDIIYQLLPSLSVSQSEWLSSRLSQPEPAQQKPSPKPKITVNADELILTDDQLQALEEILDWYDNGEDLYKVLRGYAGTGKTTLLNEVVHAIEQGLGRKVIVTATTNKAVKVLVDRVEAKNFSTIHSLLNIKPKQVGTQEVFEPDPYSPNQVPLSAYHLVIIDECSMISEKLLDIIYGENAGHTKVLFCGDPAQLQPINETISQCFDFTPSTLTQVVRHGDIIANKAKLVRSTDQHVPVEDLIAEGHIMKIDKAKIWQMFKGFREDPDRARMLCWTNNQVDYWNTQLRLADYGEPKDPFVEGDIVIANQPCLAGKEIVMMNSEEGQVINIREEDSCYLLGVKLTGGSKAQVRVVKQDYQMILSDKLRLYAEERDWRSYWKLKKHYHDIKHCYALTVHKSQGSTFENVVLDWGNIHHNRDLHNRNQLLYVGLTRASKNVWIYA